MRRGEEHHSSALSDRLLLSASVTPCVSAVLLVLPENGLSSLLPMESFLSMPVCQQTYLSWPFKAIITGATSSSRNQASFHVLRSKSVLLGLLLEVAMFSPKGSGFSLISAGFWLLCLPPESTSLFQCQLPA